MKLKLNSEQFQKYSNYIFSVLLMTSLIVGFYAFNTANQNNLQNVSVYFGNLHNHSSMTDGALSLEDLVREIKDKSNFDFVSISEHSSRRLRKNFKRLKDIANKYNHGTPIILHGEEWHSNQPYNLMNVQNLSHPIPKEFKNDHKALMQYLTNEQESNPEELIYAEFNHPRDVNIDYGFSHSFKSRAAEFVKFMDPIVQLISVDYNAFRGPKFGYRPKTTSIQVPQIKPNKFHVHKDIKDINFWFNYLLMGMHLAPKLDTGIHSSYPGRLFAGRTAVWIKGKLTKKSLLRALKNRQTYVTEDLNLKIFATVNESNLPGNILDRRRTKHINIKIEMHDPDETSAKYELEIYSGFKGGTSVNKMSTKGVTSLSRNSFLFSTKVPNQDHTFYIIKVKQVSKDPVNGSEHADSWLAPVWIE